MEWRNQDPEREQEERAEERELVVDLLRSDGWKVIRRHLKARMETIAHHIAVNVRIEPGELRAKQAQYVLLEKLLQHESALAFFTDEEK